jgi:3-oxoacyl-[acyl-carrier-protein] synthase-1
MTAHRLLRSGLYNEAIVTGGDIISEFVVSGFMSFQALSPTACKPFDLNRSGLTLGEGAGTIHVSNVAPADTRHSISITGCATTNDANHISGPSRTGEELGMAIARAMQESGLTAGEVDYIAAHGTATLFNDEMEAKALDLSGLSAVPVNSHKGYWGHTLGAAGIIESVAALASMRENFLFKSIGFEKSGVPNEINVITANRACEMNASLKAASGFGGCNAAIIFKKN